MAALSYTLGLLSLLFLVGLLIQLYCWAYRGHSGFWKYPTRRSRTNPISVIILFSILSLFYFLFFCGALYYSTWMGPDLHSTGCAVNKAVGDTLFQHTHSKDRGSFTGIINLRDQARSIHKSLDYKFVRNHADGMPSYGVFAKRALAAAYAPLLFTDAMLNQREYNDDALSLTGGKLDLGATVSVSIGKALQQTYGKFIEAVDDAPDLKKRDASQTAKTVSHGLDRFLNETGDVVDKGTKPYNSFVNAYNRMEKYLRDHHITRTLTTLSVLVSLIALLWLILASVVMIYYLSTRQYEEPLAANEWKRCITQLAGFLTFGTLIWSILLFILAAAIMLAIYPVADACAFSKYALSHKDTFTEYPKLAQGANQTYIDVCLYGDHDGRLSSLHPDINRTQLEQIPSLHFPIQALENLKFDLGHTQSEEDLLELAKRISNPRMFILPNKKPENYPDSEFFFTPETFSEKQCGDKPYNPCQLMSYNLNSDDTPPQKIRGIPSLLKECETQLAKVIEPICQPLKNTLGDKAQQEAEEEHWTKQCEQVKSSKAEIDICLKAGVLDPSCLKSLGTFAQIIKLLKLSTEWESSEAKDRLEQVNTDQLEGLSILGNQLAATQRKLRRKEDSRLPEAVPVTVWNSVTFSDPCPIGEACDIFFKLKNQGNVSDGYELVDYKTWKESWEMDTIAALSQLNTTEKVLEHVKIFMTRQTTLTAIAESGSRILENDKCYALSENLVKMDRKICDDVGGNIAGLGLMWFLMGLFGLIGSVMSLFYWTGRRKYIDRTAALQEDEIQRERHEFLSAAEAGDLARMEPFLTKFAPGDVQDAAGNTPLHVAARNGQSACVNRLVASGYDVNALNHKNSTPLMEVADNRDAPLVGRVAVVNRLADSGADMNRFDENGHTALMTSVRNRDSAEMVRLLIQKGANPELRDAYNLTAFAMARNNNDESLMNVLAEHSNSVPQYMASDSLVNEDPIRPETN